MAQTQQFRARSRRVRRVVTAVTLAASLALAACGGGLSGADSAESLVVVNWKGYGSDLEWVTTQFEEQTGAEVVHRYISSEAELIELLRQDDSAIDVALPNFQFIGPAIRDELIQPLDEARLDHFDEVHDALASQDAFYSDGELYGIPWVWGYSSIFRNTDTIPAEPSTIADLWDPKYAGKVALVDDATLNVLLASLYLGEDPADPDLDKVKQALLELKANAALITFSLDELKQAIASETVEIGVMTASWEDILQEEGLPVEVTLPPEGAIGWGDTWTISSGTQKEELAYEWINFMTSSQFQVDWANDPGGGATAPANGVASDALDDEARERTQAHPEVLGDLALQGPLPDDQLDAWLELWQEVKAE